VGITIGDPDSVFRELIQHEITMLRAAVVDLEGYMKDRNTYYINYSLEMAKIHLYISKVLLSNWEDVHD